MKIEELKAFEAYEAYHELEDDFNAPWAEIEDPDFEDELFFC